jgi:hypothetical protein
MQNEAAVATSSNCEQQQQEDLSSASTTATTATTASTKASDINSATTSSTTTFDPSEYDDKKLSSSTTWSCPSCTLENRLRAAICKACSTRKPASVDERLLELQQPSTKSSSRKMSKRKVADADTNSNSSVNQQTSTPIQATDDTTKVR